MKASASASPTPPLRDPLSHLVAAAAAASPTTTANTSTSPTTITTTTGSSTNTTTTTTTITTISKPPPPKSRKLTPSSSPSPPPSRPLSAEGEVPAALRHLRSSDPSLSPLIDSHPAPSFHHPPDPPFLSLARSILYQQLAFKAASSVYSRFLSLCGGSHRVLPHVVLSLPSHHLRQIGVSDRKASYLLDLARKYHHGILSDASVASLDDRSLSAMLTMVKGIGSWSVHMFMIFSLHRPDVLPVGDLGVRKGVQILYGLDALPRPSQMEHLCHRWRPYRSVAAWYMWRLVEARGGGPGLAAATSSSHLHFQQEMLLPPPPPPPPPQPQPQQQLLPVQNVMHTNAMTNAVANAVIQMDQHQHQQQHGEEEVVVEQVVAVHQQHQQQQHEHQLISPIQGFRNLGGWSWS